MLDLERAVLEELDVGILVCTPALDRILLFNPSAERMLAHLDDGNPLPEALREAVQEVLSRRAAPGAFASAVPVRSSGGSCLFVRAKTLADELGTLIVISGDLLRERDVAARFQLSRREAKIVELVCAGASNEQIADELNLTVMAVKHYLSGIFTALDVRSRSKLIAIVEQMSRA